MKEVENHSALSEEAISTLIKDVLKGDNSKFAPIVKSFQDSIYAIVLSQVGDTSVANDISQDTFVKAFKYLKTFKGKSSFKTWLIRIALNNVKTYFSSKAYKQKLKSDAFNSTEHEAAISKHKNLNEYTFSDELLDNARFQVSQLKDKNKEIVVLRFFEGLSYQEISKSLNIPVGTVSSRMNTALLALRSKLREVC